MSRSRGSARASVYSVSTSIRSGRSFLIPPRSRARDSALRVQNLSLHDSAFNEKKSDFRRKVTNYPLINGDILLFEALRCKLVGVVIDLICAQSNVNHRNAIGWTPLLTAISVADNIKCIVVLIAAKATLSDVDLHRVKAFKHIGDQLLCLLQCVVVVGDGGKGNATA